MKAVFDVKPGSGYDDDIAQRYHFPARSNYLNAARNAVGDWVLFREPQRNRGRRAYVATARVTKVEADPERPSLSYAYVDNYLEFAAPVPLVVNGRYAETTLRRIADPQRVGRALQGKSLRPIPDDDFRAIVLAGLRDALAPEDIAFFGLNLSVDELSTFEVVAEQVDRRIEALLVNRKIRDANFRLDVCRVYDSRCAVTGLRIVDGEGHAEVQAAHIRPVAAGGPDAIQNGIALSATVHWLFDHQLISVGENYDLLISGRVPLGLRDLFRSSTEGLHLPERREDWPHPKFLAHHRNGFALRG